jgi:hypothetical protein
MKVLGAAFVTLMKMRSSSALRSMYEERCAGSGSCGVALRRSPCRSLAASPGGCRKAVYSRNGVLTAPESNA